MEISYVNQKKITCRAIALKDTSTESTRPDTIISLMKSVYDFQSKITVEFTYVNQ